MKKIALLLIVLMISFTAFAADSIVETGTLVQGTTNNSAKLGYTLTTTGDDAVSVYKIGFSTNQITALDDTPSAVADNPYSFTMNDDFTGTIDSVYVFWQIASNVSCTISLTPSVMTGETYSDTLNVTLETTNSAGTGGTQTLYSETNTSESDLTKTILEYAPATTEDQGSNQAAGSQLINLTTDNIVGLSPDTYTGELTLTIVASN